MRKTRPDTPANQKRRACSRRWNATHPKELKAATDRYRMRLLREEIERQKRGLSDPESRGLSAMRVRKLQRRLLGLPPRLCAFCSRPLHKLDRGHYCVECLPEPIDSVDSVEIDEEAFWSMRESAGQRAAPPQPRAEG